MGPGLFDFTIFQAGCNELQVKESQKADMKACCLDDEFNNEKQLVEGKYHLGERLNADLLCALHHGYL